MQDTNEFVLELDMLEPRTLPTAIVPGGRRGKLAAGGVFTQELASAEQGTCSHCPQAGLIVEPIIEPA